MRSSSQATLARVGVRRSTSSGQLLDVGPMFVGEMFLVPALALDTRSTLHGDLADFDESIFDGVEEVKNDDDEVAVVDNDERDGPAVMAAEAARAKAKTKAKTKAKAKAMAKSTGGGSVRRRYSAQDFSVMPMNSPISFYHSGFSLWGLFRGHKSGPFIIVVCLLFGHYIDQDKLEMLSQHRGEHEEVHEGVREEVVAHSEARWAREYADCYDKVGQPNFFPDTVFLMTFAVRVSCFLWSFSGPRVIRAQNWPNHTVFQTENRTFLTALIYQV